MDLLLFDHPEHTHRADALGLDGVLIDFERRGKHDRQAGADTAISAATIDDVAPARAATGQPVIVRVDGPDGLDPSLAARLADLGVDEVLLPMVRHPGELERAQQVAEGLLAVGMLAETADAVRRAGAALPIVSGGHAHALVRRCIES